MTLWQRIKSALAVLFLPGDRTPVTRHDLAEFRGEWAEWELTLASMFEKLNTWAAREARRQKRAHDRTMLAGEGDAVSASGPQRPSGDARARKLLLYRKVAVNGPPPDRPESET